MTKLLIDRAVVEQGMEALRMCVPMDGRHSDVDAAFQDLRAALAEADTCTWQPMDTAPFDTDLLVINESGFVFQDYRSKQYPSTWTYWMPLPANPEAA